jgi:AcrR family transcriptional regulator
VEETMAAKASRKRARRPEAAARSSDPAARIVDATLELVAGRGWRHVSLADIASAAGLSLAEL